MHDLARLKDLGFNIDIESDDGGYFIDIPARIGGKGLVLNLDEMTMNIVDSERHMLLDIFDGKQVA